MKSIFRLDEYKVLFYRVLLAYFFYFIARILFYVFNSEIVEVASISEFLRISYHGLAFDTTAILYVNGIMVWLLIPLLFYTLMVCLFCFPFCRFSSIQNPNIRKFYSICISFRIYFFMLLTL